MNRFGLQLRQCGCGQIVDHAAGQVRLAPERDSAAGLAWRTGDGDYRHIGAAPPGAQTIPPTIEDGYLLLIGDGARAGIG